MKCIYTKSNLSKTTSYANYKIPSFTIPVRQITNIISQHFAALPTVSPHFCQLRPQSAHLSTHHTHNIYLYICMSSPFSCAGRHTLLVLHTYVFLRVNSHMNESVYSIDIYVHMRYICSGVVWLNWSQGRY